MERQALHRVDQGDLTDEQEERLGATLMVLHDRMSVLCAQYGLTMEDLNLDSDRRAPCCRPAAEAGRRAVAPVRPRRRAAM
jgi:hypothetical protein